MINPPTAETFTLHGLRNEVTGARLLSNDIRRHEPATKVAGTLRVPIRARFPHTECAGYLQEATKRSSQIDHIIHRKTLPVPVRQTHDREADAHVLELELPAMPGMIELTLAGDADVDESIFQQPSRTVFLPVHMAQLHISPASAQKRVAVNTNQLFAAVTSRSGEGDQG